MGFRARLNLRYVKYASLRNVTTTFNQSVPLWEFPKVGDPNLAPKVVGS